MAVAFWASDCFRLPPRFLPAEAAFFGFTFAPKLKLVSNLLLGMCLTSCPGSCGRCQGRRQFERADRGTQEADVAADGPGANVQLPGERGLPTTGQRCPLQDVGNPLAALLLFLPACRVAAA